MNMQRAIGIVLGLARDNASGDSSQREAIEMVEEFVPQIISDYVPASVLLDHEFAALLRVLEQGGEAK